MHKRDHWFEVNWVPHSACLIGCVAQWLDVIGYQEFSQTGVGIFRLNADSGEA